MSEDVFFENDGVNLTPDKLAERLKKLPLEFSSKNGGLLRQVMFQVAKVVEQRAKQTVAIKHTKTGNLGRAIRKYRDRNPQYENATEAYVIAVNRGRKRIDSIGEGKKAAYYWTWVHFGSIHNEADPFLINAFESTTNDQLLAFTNTFQKKLLLAEKKLKAKIK